MGGMEANSKEPQHPDPLHGQTLFGMPFVIDDSLDGNGEFTMSPLPEWIEVDRGELPPMPE